tara:strand:+ start:937 stop:1272 length:336 start_codon:yes stop_codon:yes gene_type:complete
MSLQRLAGFDLAATTNTLLYQCPDDHHALVTVSMISLSGTPTVRLALTASSTPAATDWLIYDFALAVGGANVERKGIAMGAGNRLYGYASATNVTVVVYGTPERLQERQNL